MKVVHIESGLGNQMLSYCELLALRKMNPKEKCYIETIIYGIRDSHRTICQWNGYELEKIFGISENNIRDFFTPESWDQILAEIRESRFWEKNWNYPVYFTEIFRKYGLSLVNARGDFEEGSFLRKCEADYHGWKNELKNSSFYRYLKKVYYKAKEQQLIEKSADQASLFLQSDEDLFTGQRLLFKYKGNGIEKIDKEIKSAFRFPKLRDDRDIQLLRQIQETESVAVHARRGDMLSANGYCYKNGYFRSAVRYIKKHVERPVFLFFCDPGSIAWCRENQRIFGLNMEKDQIVFVDWHDGEESYRDMQLMAQCKHNIITNSSFGWWGSYLNVYPNKITISPDPLINTVMWM